MEPIRIFSTRPVNFKIYAGWPVDRFFLPKVFVNSLFNVCYEKFSKGSWGEVLKFVTPDGNLRKETQKIIAFFAKLTQF